MSLTDYRLEDLGEFKNGVNFSTDKMGKGFPLINVKDITNSKFLNSSKMDLVDLEITGNAESNVAKSGDIFFVRSSVKRDGVGMVGMLDNYEKEVIHCGFVIRFRPSVNFIFSKFLLYLLGSPLYREKIKNLSSGATIVNISQTSLKKLEIQLPPVNTQKRIASILSAYDDLIENNLKRIKLLEETAQNIYKEWFVNFRFPNYENTPFNEETGLPKGWEMKKLSELVFLTMGQSPESEFYNTNGEGLPFHQGVTGYGNRFVSHSTYCSKITRIAEEGDILFSVRAPVGRLNIAPERLIIGRGLSAMRNKKGLQTFQFYQLKQHFFQEDLIGGGAIFNSVTKTELENQTLIFPNFSIQENFEGLVKPIDLQVWKLNVQNQKLKEARDILLPRLMNRTIEV